jgi:hypothetical protein
MQYAPLLKLLRGRPVKLEIGDPSRQAVDSATGVVWELFFGDSLLLLVVPTEQPLPKPAEVFKAEQDKYKAAVTAQQGDPNAVKLEIPNPNYACVEWQFRWIRTANIIMVYSDAQAMINMNLRQFSKPKIEPLYRDKGAYWHMLNNMVSKQIAAKLKELGLQSDFDGVYRDGENNPVPSAKAELPQAPVPAAAQTVNAVLIPPAPGATPVPLHAETVKLQGV